MMTTESSQKNSRCLNYVCIHGHFYQPPRENPWLEEIEIQDSASPFHDWNARISAECYAPNLDSRILGPEGRIIKIVNNFSKISHDLGPTLMSWLEKKRPDIYGRLVQTDRESREEFSGHGPAMAQAYNHTILPLAESRDKRLQIIWGIRDFRYRYGRAPEGLWLPETAVDMESLEILADQGITFTILAPRQAARIRRLGGNEWTDVRGEKVDPRRPYVCRLPSGRTIAIFFYDGPTSRDIAFGGLLKSGDLLSSRLASLFSSEKSRPELVHTAVDGETFGHHHKFTEMALSYALDSFESGSDIETTVYGEYLEKFPPDTEVEIIPDTSWSCVHGVERWRSGCGCSTGGHPTWTQQWRAPLRQAMDWLNGQLSEFFEERISALKTDPWKLREDFIDVILDRSFSSVEDLFQRHNLDTLSRNQKSVVLQHLEMQRACQLMFTSCGWFFDEISGIETIQILKYAARAMELAARLGAGALEPDFIRFLDQAPSNVKSYGTGAEVYHRLVQPAVVSLKQAGIHFAVSTAFEEFSGQSKVGIFDILDKKILFKKEGDRILSAGTLDIRSPLTWEKDSLDYAVYYSGGHHLFAGAAEPGSSENNESYVKNMEEAFGRGHVQALKELMDRRLGGHAFSLEHLLKDRRRAVMAGIMREVHGEFKEAFLKLFHRNYPLLLAAERMGIPLPEGGERIIAAILQSRVNEALEKIPPENARVKGLLKEMAEWGLTPRLDSLEFTASERMSDFFSRMDKDRKNPELLHQAASYLSLIEDLGLSPQFWKPQTIFFRISEELGPEMRRRAENNDASASDWIESQMTIARILRIKNA